MDLFSSSKQAANAVLFDEAEAIHGRIEARLASLLPETDNPDPLTQAVRDAALSGGKRARSILLVLAARGLGSRSSGLIDLGCAVEMMHSASLVLDDMPCMDNAQLRRGRMTTHRRYGEDLAILAAVALLTRAFSVISDLHDIPAEVRTRMVSELSDAVGMEGLVRGQYQDLREGRRSRSAGAVTATNTLKTGRLFEAPVVMAGLAAGAPAPTIESLRQFALSLGQAFQLCDDLTDTRSGNGKDPGQDAGKATLVAMIGAERARQRLEHCLGEADAHLRAVYGPDQAVSRFIHGLFARLDQDRPAPARKASH